MTNTQKAVMQQALDALVHVWNTTPDDDVIVDNAIATLRKTLAEPVVEPVAWLYTLEYGATVVNTSVSLHQLNYPFGVCGTDYARANDGGFSYVRQTPLYTSPQPPPDEMPLLTGDQYRSEFEAFVNAELGDVAVTDQGRYISPKIQNYWRVWQAAIQKAGIK